MSSSDGSAATILKILSGVQSGVDVALLDGVYTLGSSEDDDIQIFDVSLKPGHAKLSIKPGKLEIAGGTGQLRTRNGLVLEPAGELQEIEQLDVVSAGATRFALGARTANWASITDEDSEIALAARRPIVEARTKGGGAGIPAWLAWRSVLPVAAVLALTAGGIAAVPFFGADRLALTGSVSGDELAGVRDAVKSFDFGRELTVTQEVDGAIFVTGFVDTPVQRRAIVGAIKELNIPVRVRVAVRDVIRDDVASLIGASGHAVSYELARDGKLTLSGVILDPKEATDLVDLIRDRVIGLNSVDSKIRTSPILLADAKGLAERSQVAPLVLLRLDGIGLIEASGVVPSEKIDAWVGFLQAYSNQFAELIPLRSLVRLQNPDGTVGEPGAPPPTPLYLGNAENVSDKAKVDVERLRSGKFELSDVFVGQKPVSDAKGDGTLVAAGEGSAKNSAEAGNDPKGGTDETKGKLDLDGLLLAFKGERGQSVSGMQGNGPAGGGDEAGQGSLPEEAGGLSSRSAQTPQPVRIVGDTGSWTPQPEQTALRPVQGERQGSISSLPTAEGELWARAAQAASAKLNPVNVSDSPATTEPLMTMAQELIARWTAGTLGDTAAGRQLREGMDALEKRRRSDAGSDGKAGPEGLAEHYSTLLGRASFSSADACWPGATLTRQTVGGALFWLDLFSVSRNVSVRDLSPDVQGLVLEAAFSPRRANACFETATGKRSDSVYLAEVSRNAAFIDYISRDLENFPIDIAGVSLSGDRYIQTRAGQKMREGSAPDETSRISFIGELGVAVERSNGYSTGIFGPDLNWVTQ